MAGGGDTDMRSWADLLHHSSQLLHSSTPSAQFPPIQRSLDQLESLSRQLKARTSRFEAPNENIAATRLLAREGINAEQLTRDLKSFELKTTFEDVFPVEATSVEEYCQQVHEMAVLSAIQEAQRDNVRNFDDYMFKEMMDDWNKEKREFLNNLSRLPFASSASSDGASSALQRQTSRSPATALRPTPESRSLEYTSVAQRSILEKKASLYGEAVVKLNVARERGLPYKVAIAFRSAYDGVAGEIVNSKSVNMAKIWHLLQALLGEDLDRTNTSSKKMAMVAGARRHLEAGHEKYILDTIQSHPTQAVLGGSTGNLNRIRAFLRVRLRDHGLLDFDCTDARRQPPMDTTWHQIYFCLRTGYYDEAQQIAHSSRVSRSFAPQLAEWIANEGDVSSATAAAVTEECERMARIGDRPGRPGYDKKKMLLHAIVSGSRLQGDRLLRDIPVLFSTIEDFMWFKLAMVRNVPSRSPSTSVAQQSMALYTLEDLQNYLVKFEPSYYTKNGKDPLVYPYVLLLSVQLHAAIAYIMKEGDGGEGYSVDAVHIAVALADHGVLSEGLDGAQKVGAMDAVSEVASIIRQYGLSHVRQGNLGQALEYYVQAAAAVGGGAISWSGSSTSGQQRQRQLMLKQLLTEILLRDGGIALLLGSSGSAGGSLKRFLPDPQAQHHLLLDAARQCEESGLYDRAVELLKRIGAYAMALEIINQRLSDAISAMVSGRSDGETKIAGLIYNGNEVLEAQKAGDSSAQDRDQISVQQAAFRQLESILTFHKLARTSRYGDALRELSKLSFLPLEGRTPERSAEALRTIPLSVQSCIPDLLKVAITCLDNVTETDGSVRLLKTKIANFVANSLPRNLPQDLYERVARML